MPNLKHWQAMIKFSKWCYFEENLYCIHVKPRKRTLFVWFVLRENARARLVSLAQIGEIARRLALACLVYS